MRVTHLDFCEIKLLFACYSDVRSRPKDTAGIEGYWGLNQLSLPRVWSPVCSRKLQRIQAGKTLVIAIGRGEMCCICINYTCENNVYPRHVDAVGGLLRPFPFHTLVGLSRTICTFYYQYRTSLLRSHSDSGQSDTNSNIWLPHMTTLLAGWP